MSPAGALVALVIGAPVLCGALFTLGLSLGLPGAPGFGAYAQALALPGIGRSLAVTLISGLGATLIATAAALPLSAFFWRRPRLQAALAPVLAIPHAALAIGLAFLIAPSGWIARLLLPGPVPPGWVSVGDPMGITLALGLALKETPFLVLMALAAASQIPVAAQMRAGQGPGHAPRVVWRRVIWPQIHAALRLPIAISLAFALSVADMALVLGPSHPPTLAVQILRLSTAPDPALRAPAAALAVMLLALMALAVLLWRGAERPVARLTRRLAPGDRTGAGLALIGALLSLGALAVLLLWAFAARWPWPDALPHPGLAAWRRADWGRPLATTLSLGAIVTALALLLAIALLEAEGRRRRIFPLPLLLLPLLLPQISFLPGLTTGFLWLRLPPGPVAVIWAELLFVFPYVVIALAGPWRALDPAMLRSAASLGASPGRVFWRIRLPLLARPLALAAVVGFAVSVAQYLAVLLPGAGRVATLATEAVTLSSGADRRLAAALGLLQALLPLTGYAAAITLPRGARRRDLPDRD